MRLRLVDRRREAAAAALPVDASVLQRLVADLGLREWELAVVLVDDVQMTDLNVRYHGGDGPTDVLSFSYLESADPADLEAGQGEAAGPLRLPADAAGESLAGEVILAPAFIADRCGEHGWDLAREWALLVVHGALHVLGWQHADGGQRHAMQAREAAILARQGFAHSLLTGESPT